jgi:hypothetical protein
LVFCPKTKSRQRTGVGRFREGEAPAEPQPVTPKLLEEKMGLR